MLEAKEINLVEVDENKNSSFRTKFFNILSPMILFFIVGDTLLVNLKYFFKDFIVQEMSQGISNLALKSSPFFINMSILIGMLSIILYVILGYRTSKNFGGNGIIVAIVAFLVLVGSITFTVIPIEFLIFSYQLNYTSFICVAILATLIEKNLQKKR